MKRFLARAKEFITTVAKTVKRKIFGFVRGVYEHAETITVLILASFGLNLWLGELPFIFYLPMWIEATMVIPVLSVLGISLLVKCAEWRANRRAAAVA